jgi:hypothetical protein
MLGLVLTALDEPPSRCFVVSLAEVEGKRTEMTSVHEAFGKQYLETDERIGTPFARMNKAVYPNSKRGPGADSSVGLRYPKCHGTTVLVAIVTVGKLRRSYC